MKQQAENQIDWRNYILQSNWSYFSKQSEHASSGPYSWWNPNQDSVPHSWYVKAQTQMAWCTALRIWVIRRFASSWVLNLWPTVSLNFHHRFVMFVKTRFCWFGHFYFYCWSFLHLQSIFWTCAICCLIYWKLCPKNLKALFCLRP